MVDLFHPGGGWSPVMKRPMLRTLAFLAAILTLATAVVIQLRRTVEIQAELATYDSTRHLWRIKVSEVNRSAASSL
jgi:hypothetical protein